ncbi:hypothetical protein QCA50_016555 [Cerrena zonata]|uniref:GPI-anchored wall transfer protein 1 n=1 Tax=Cerrena zonata TaxID=2478898 RepID=A0AAW0FMS0_9APHY
MTTSDYKSSKEAFVSGMSGSSIGHINMVSFVALSSIALHSALRTRLPPSKPLTLPSEFLVLAVPLLLSVTVAANAPGLLNLCLLALTMGVVTLMPRRESGNVLPVGGTGAGGSRSREGREDSTSSERHGGDGDQEEDVRGMSRDGSATLGITHIPLFPPLTTYRAHMLLLTAICILAVDFPVFPRSLAKCETFGVSIMDLGVGSFVFSQGVVSALPIIKNPIYLTAPFLPKVSVTLRKCLPLLILGLLRTVSVKGTEYPEHETEYGTHWNFFITLGLLPLLQVLLHPFIVYLPISLLGVIVAISHQIALSSGGLASYVFNAPRSTLISANKEGLVSLIGYLAIHLLGLSTGTLVLPPSPSYFRRQQELLIQRRYQAASPASTTSPTSTFNPPLDPSHDPSSSVASGVGLSPTRSPTRERFSEMETEFQFPPRSPTISRRPSFDITRAPGESVDGVMTSPSGTHLSPYPASPATATFHANLSPTAILENDVVAEQGERQRSNPGAVMKRENDRTAIELCSYAVLWWVSLGVEKLFGVGGGVSRRLVNLQYITWCSAFNTTFLLGYLLLDLIFFPSPLSKSIYSPVSGLKVIPMPAPSLSEPTPPGARGRDGRSGGSSVNPSPSVTVGEGVGGAPKLLSAINRNGLVLFLVVRIDSAPTKLIRNNIH